MLRRFEGSKHVALYAKCRPKTPGYLPEKIVTYMKQRNSSFELMLDVGCGSGQSTDVFSPYFSKIIGIDPSSKQIEMANQINQTENISYKVGIAENLPVSDESVDLISSSSAVHWFDIPAFLKECHRVLKPNGCLLLHAYYKSRPYLAEQLKTISEKSLIKIGDQLLYDFQTECALHPSYDHLKDHYKGIFDQIKCNFKVRDSDLRIDADMKFSDQCSL